MLNVANILHPWIKKKGYQEQLLENIDYGVEPWVTSLSNSEKSDR